MPEGTVVTFYSYKGGVGRTLALANIGALLTRWGYKVLCVDWDLEAPGLHLYFDRWIQKDTTSGESILSPGLTELIHDYVDGKQPRWLEFLTEVHFPETAKPLKLMTAGRLDESYVQRMQTLDWKRLYEDHQLGNFLEQLRSEWKEAFDFVLIDSRTGITDIGGICTVQLPDLLLLFTANLQSLRGSLDVVNRAKQTRASLPFDRAKLLVLPVATRFEMRVEYELAQQWLKTFATELQAIYSEWVHKDVAAEDMLNHTRVPYIPFWSFGEKLPVIEKGTDDPDDIGFSFETLAALVAQKFSFSDVLTENRDSFVAAARRSQSQNGSGRGRKAKSDKAIKVFISYTDKDKTYRDQLEKHLKPLERQGLIEIWDYYQNAHGESWEYEFERHLDAADVVLLLVSSDFLATDFLYQIEMRRALQRQESGEATVLPVILRPVNWAGSPIAKLQVLPSQGKPVTAFPDTDEPLAEVAQKVYQLATNLKLSRMA